MIPAACWPRNPATSWLCRAAQDATDGGGRDVHAKPKQFSFAALVAPARVLPGQADEQLLNVRVQRWSAGPVVRVGHAPATSRQRQRQRSSVCGPTRKHDQRAPW